MVSLQIPACFFPAVAFFFSLFSSAFALTPLTRAHRRPPRRLGVQLRPQAPQKQTVIFHPVSLHLGYRSSTDAGWRGKRRILEKAGQREPRLPRRSRGDGSRSGRAPDGGDGDQGEQCVDEFKTDERAEVHGFSLSLFRGVCCFHAAPENQTPRKGKEGRRPATGVRASETSEGVTTRRLVGATPAREALRSASAPV